MVARADRAELLGGELVRACAAARTAPSGSCPGRDGRPSPAPPPHAELRSPRDLAHDPRDAAQLGDVSCGEVGPRRLVSTVVPDDAVRARRRDSAGRRSPRPYGDRSRTSRSRRRALSSLPNIRGWSVTSAPRHTGVPCVTPDARMESAGSRAAVLRSKNGATLPRDARRPRARDPLVDPGALGPTTRGNGVVPPRLRGSERHLLIPAPASEQTKPSSSAARRRTALNSRRPASRRVGDPPSSTRGRAPTCRSRATTRKVALRRAGRVEPQPIGCG